MDKVKFERKAEPEIEIFERDIRFFGQLMHQKTAFSIAGRVEVNTCNVFDNPPDREWETCIFNMKIKNGKTYRVSEGSRVVETYPSWEAALEGHKKWVKFFGENPERGPKDVPHRPENPFGLLVKALEEVGGGDSTDES